MKKLLLLVVLTTTLTPAFAQTVVIPNDNDTRENLRPDGRDRSEFGFHQRDGDQLYPRQHDWPGYCSGGRGLRYRHPQGRKNPAGNRQCAPDDPGNARAQYRVPRVRRRQSGF